MEGDSKLKGVWGKFGVTKKLQGYFRQREN